MFGLFKKTITDNIKDFQTESNLAQFFSCEYLMVWLKQIFESPEFKNIFPDPETSKAMAIEVSNYLSAEDPDRVFDHGSQNDLFNLVKTHAEKWADDVMEKDFDFAKLRIMTLRLDMIYAQHTHGVAYSTPRLERIKKLLMKYGHLDTDEPTPEKYTNLIKKWILWDKQIKKEGLLNF